MPTYGSIYFPFRQDLINQSIKHTTTVKDTIESSIRAFVRTKPGTRRGNTIGCFLSSIKHQLTAPEIISAAQERLTQELTVQFRGITFDEIKLVPDLQDEVSNLRVHIWWSSSYISVQELVVLL